MVRVLRDLVDFYRFKPQNSTQRTDPDVALGILDDRFDLSGKTILTRDFDESAVDESTETFVAAHPDPTSRVLVHRADGPNTRFVCDELAARVSDEHCPTGGPDVQVAALSGF